MSYNEQLNELIELAKLQAIYQKKLRQAHDFAGKQEDGATWNGLFLMGLAMNGLDLIPYSCDITPRPYWRQAPEPKGGTGEWQISWVAEVDAFTRKDAP